MNDDEVVDMKTTKNVKWVAKLVTGLRNATVAGGRVYAGTNNESPETQARKEIAAWACLDEKTGDLLAAGNPQTGCRKVSDWEYIGVARLPPFTGQGLCSDQPP